MKRRKSEPGAEAFIRFLTGTPWWVGPICAVLAYVAFRFVIPAAAGSISGPNGPMSSIFAGTLSPVAVSFAPYAGLLVLFAWGVAESIKLANRRRLDRQTGAESIGDLSWEEFEELVAEAYRREGYQVERTGNASGDGGIDVVLRRNGQMTLVQCKHWKTWTVGVKVVDDLCKALEREGADYGIVVSYGTFTPKAADVAQKNCVTLVGGDELVELIGSVQRRPRMPTDAPAASRAASNDRPEPTRPPSQAAPACPRCGSAMVERIAGHGAGAGSRFWGCTKFPRCHGTRQL